MSFWIAQIAKNSTKPTAAIVVYWRLRYARAPCWTALEIACMRSFPGDSASRERVVRRPYATAHPAQTRATTTPWFVRKLLKENPPRSDLRAARGFARTFVGRIALRGSAHPVQTRAESIALAFGRAAEIGSAPWNPQAPARLRRPRPARTLILVGGRLAGLWRAGALARGTLRLLSPACGR